MEPSGKITKSIAKENVERDWRLVDVEGMTLGRAATQIAVLLRGKHKPYFTPHVDCGDFVIAVNADKIQIKGKREAQKQYFSYTGYPGGAIFRSFKDLKEKKPEFLIWHAVKGMLPKNRLGRQIIKKLKVYSGGEHPHAAQKPQLFELKK